MLRGSGPVPTATGPHASSLQAQGSPICLPPPPSLRQQLRVSGAQHFLLGFTANPTRTGRGWGGGSVVGEAGGCGCGQCAASLGTGEETGGWVSPSPWSFGPWATSGVANCSPTSALGPQTQTQQQEGGGGQAHLGWWEAPPSLAAEAESGGAGCLGPSCPSHSGLRPSGCPRLPSANPQGGGVGANALTAHCVAHACCHRRLHPGE